VRARLRRTETGPGPARKSLQRVPLLLDPAFARAIPKARQKPSLPRKRESRF
jgi:hypothetical protein